MQALAQLRSGQDPLQAADQSFLSIASQGKKKARELSGLILWGHLPAK